jgi:hypothetical protein
VKSRKVLIGLLTTLLASSCSLVIKPVRPSTTSSQPTSSSVKPSTSSSASSSSASSSSSSSSSGSGSDEWVEDLDLSDKAGYDAHVYIHHKSDGTKYYIDEDGNKHTGSENEEWVF